LPLSRSDKGIKQEVITTINGREKHVFLVKGSELSSVSSPHLMYRTPSQAFQEGLTRETTLYDRTEALKPSATSATSATSGSFCVLSAGRAFERIPASCLHARISPASKGQRSNLDSNGMKQHACFHFRCVS
jgi:hypothetical protein